MPLKFSRSSELGAKMAAAVVTVCDESATRIEQDVKGGAHSFYRVYPETPSYTRTGNMGRSFHKTKAKLSGGAVTVEIGSDPGVAPYTRFVEYGTVRMPAKPFLRPSVAAEKPLFEAKLRAALLEAASL